MSGNNVAEFGFISEMSWDCMSEEIDIRQRPPWSDVEARIRALNKPEYSGVFLKAMNGTLLTVAGDEKHGFLVFTSDQCGYS